MLDFVLSPLRSSLRSFLGVAEHEAAEIPPVEKAEAELPDIVHALQGATEGVEGATKALQGATEAVEDTVEVIKQLAALLDPFKDSVNSLNETMKDLVKILGPIAAVEHGVHDVEHFFGHHRHQPDAPDSDRG
jgi:hypothetical protein